MWAIACANLRRQTRMLWIRVAVDVDGVLANFDEAAARVINTIAPGTILDPANYQPKVFGSWFGLEKEMWEHIDATNNWWVSLLAYHDNMAALQSFAFTGPHII